MRKSTIFISAALTTFALAIVYGVVYAYRGMATTNAPVQTQVAPTATEVPSATPEAVTPQQAAQLAAQVLGHNDLLSAESSNVKGVNAYKITFQSGDIVYVGLDGQILSIQTAPKVIMVQAPTQPAHHKSNDNTANNAGNNGGEHENEGGG